MRTTLHLRPVLLLLLALPAVVPATALAQGFADVEDRVVEHTLENGLKVIVLERHIAPVVSCFTLARVGSSDERPGITGLAHLFEHMAFKGTPEIGTTNYEAEVEAMAKVDEAYAALTRAKAAGADGAQLEELEKQFKSAQDAASEYAVAEFDKALEVNGGTGLNAFTSSDQTGYVISLPSNKIELWAVLESERFLNPVLREFYKERNVVMEERRLRTDSNPFGKFIEEGLAAAFRAHPYGWPTVGHMSDLLSLTRKDGKEFFEKHYVASNLIVAVVGDVDAKHVIALCETYFGRLPKRPPPERVRTVEPPQTGERIAYIEDPAQPIYAAAFHKPAASHPDDIVFDAMSDILSSGRTSRLHKRLVKEEKIALQVGAFSGFPGNRYPNLFMIYAVPTAGHSAEEVETAIHEEVERMKTELVSEDELRKAKTRSRAGTIRGLQSNMGMARMLTFYEDITGDWKNLWRDTERFQQISAEDIQRVANETFENKNRTTIKLVTTKPEKPSE